MNLRNRVQLIGNLGADPKVTNFESGNKIARISVATTDVYKRGNEFIKDTQWHSVILWGKHAEIAEKNLTKGIEVVIDGRIGQRSYTDKQGVKRFITEITANTMIYNKKIQDLQFEKQTNKSA